MKLTLRYDIRRVSCPKCQAVKVERVPWALGPRGHVRILSKWRGSRPAAPYDSIRAILLPTKPGGEPISTRGRGWLPAFSNVLAVRYQALYSNHVSNAFGAPAGQQYIYLHGGRIKINAHNGTDFVVVAFENGIWDISSGYKPFASGGAATKWNGADRGLRFWTY